MSCQQDPGRQGWQSRHRKARRKTCVGRYLNCGSWLPCCFVCGTAVSRRRCLTAQCISVPRKTDQGYSSMTGACCAVGVDGLLAPRPAIRPLLDRYGTAIGPSGRRHRLVVGRGIPELPPRSHDGWFFRWQLLHLARPEASPTLDLERVRDAESFAVASCSLCAPARCQARECIVVDVGELRRCRHGGHVASKITH